MTREDRAMGLDLRIATDPSALIKLLRFLGSTIPA
jgi:hypothetical protein